MEVQVKSATDITERLYGVSTDRFEELLEAFCDELGEFMLREQADLEDCVAEETRDPKTLAFNVLINGITNFAVAQYAKVIIAEGHGLHAAKEIILEHFAGCFDANFIHKRTSHQEQQGVQ